MSATQEHVERLTLAIESMGDTIRKLLVESMQQTVTARQILNPHGAPERMAVLRCLRCRRDSPPLPFMHARAIQAHVVCGDRDIVGQACGGTLGVAIPQPEPAPPSRRRLRHCDEGDSDAAL